MVPAKSLNDVSLRSHNSVKTVSRVQPSMAWWRVRCHFIGMLKWCRPSL